MARCWVLLACCLVVGSLGSDRHGLSLLCLCQTARLVPYMHDMHTICSHRSNLPALELQLCNINCAIGRAH